MGGSFVIIREGRLKHKERKLRMSTATVRQHCPMLSCRIRGGRVKPKPRSLSTTDTEMTMGVNVCHVHTHVHTTYIQRCPFPWGLLRGPERSQEPVCFVSSSHSPPNRVAAPRDSRGSRTGAESLRGGPQYLVVLEESEEVYHVAEDMSKGHRARPKGFLLAKSEPTTHQHCDVTSP